MIISPEVGMNTFIYMVRHGDSPKYGEERKRGLTDKGILDAKRVTSILKSEDIQIVISSPYDRSLQTVQETAELVGSNIIIYEELREKSFTDDNTRIADKALLPVLRKSFSNQHYSTNGGESNYECQKRAISVLKEILNKYPGRKVVIGTHGAVMTLMMRYFDRAYNLNFLLGTSKPDIYRMEFKGLQLIGVKRLWEPI